MIENQNTKSRPAVPVPPAVETFQQSLLDLTGLDVGTIANETGLAMRGCMVADSEALAVMYLRAVQSLQRAILTTLHKSNEDKPLTVWAAASQVRSLATDDLVNRLTSLRNQFESRTPPAWIDSRVTHVQLNPAVEYSVTSDVRNNAPVAIRYADTAVDLAPGESCNVTSTDNVAVSSAEASVISWARIGGSYRVGSLSNCLPMPRVTRVDQPAQQTVVPTPKRKKFLGVF